MLQQFKPNSTTDNEPEPMANVPIMAHRPPRDVIISFTNDGCVSQWYHGTAVLEISLEKSTDVDNSGVFRFDV